MLRQGVDLLQEIALTVIDLVLEMEDLEALQIAVELMVPLVWCK
jgi:hypothetical protein